MKQISEKSSRELMHCMATNDFHGFLEIESNATIATAMQGGQLRKIEKSVGKKNVLKSLSFFITNFNNNFNAKGKLNEMQIIMLASDLFEVFGYESIEDAMLMFKLARQGRIGDGRDFKLDSQTVFHKWVPEYLDLKAQERENTHNRRKGEMNGMATFDWKTKDLDNLNLSDKVELVKKGFGERVREALNTDHLDVPKQIVNHEDFYKKMGDALPKMKNESLNSYLKTNNSDPNKDIKLIGMVQQELKTRAK